MPASPEACQHPLRCVPHHPHMSPVQWPPHGPPHRLFSGPLMVPHTACSVAPLSVLPRARRHVPPLALWACQVSGELCTSPAEFDYGRQGITQHQGESETWFYVAVRAVVSCMVGATVPPASSIALTYTAARCSCRAYVSTLLRVFRSGALSKRFQGRGCNMQGGRHDSSAATHWGARGGHACGTFPLRIHEPSCSLKASRCRSPKHTG